MSLDDIDHGAALQDRVDVKFIVDAATLDALVERLAPTHGVLEIAGARVFAYETTYFDTAALRSLHEHLQGRRRRYKIRRRRYLDTGHATLELKVKGPRGHTVKHALLGDGAALSADDLAFLDARLRRAYGFGLPHDELRPMLTVGCSRVTLAAPDLRERVTCDLDVDFGGAGLTAGSTIVECKSAGGRSLAARTLRDLGARPVERCSKYCLGMALTRDGVRANDLLRLLRGHFDQACVAQPVAVAP